MKLIKLDAIDSTNDFLKGLSQNQSLENFTVVTAKTQTKGKGQMGSIWETESGKNLIISILIKESILNINELFHLNVIVTVSIIQVLNTLKIPYLQIKWPNDIMSDTKKIAGILIENSIKENEKIDSVIGIGLNINQTNFEKLPKASSLKNITNKEFDVEEIIEKIVLKIEENIKKNTISFFWEEYHRFLFKKGIPTLFENPNKERFMGIIERVNPDGRLEVSLEDDSVKSFGIKEITMIY
ncbi:biotin--[acetyl-CoA-carboxylase] ligase [Flavobacterium sp.]|uniref:biotin--[acetyl-CoA-carboxylase] ligase n=1 Tax=Flavobacterium sp. TaxID=239 RepID=UPI00286DE5D1|nr:biotin--[acetyl-CoA-carboxylase] ligase [Flavobacterium sp.]